MLRLLAALLLLASAAHAQDVLHVYNWTDYIPPETVQRFEKENRCKVVYTTYGSNEELLAKLAAGAKGYDIIVPTDYAVEILIRQDALLPLDRSKLKNWGNLDPAFLDRPFDPGNRYSVPYAYGLALLGYNEKKMKALGIPTDTWAALFEPKHLEKMKGKVTVLDDQKELVGDALRYLGYPAGDTDESHWKEAAALIRRAKPYWAAFNGTSYIRLLASGQVWLVHGYSMDVYQAQEAADKAGKGVRIGYSIPKEGSTMGMDNLVILKTAPRPDLAHRFIDFMLDGRNAAGLTNQIGAGNPNRAALRHVDPKLAKNKVIFPDAETMARLENLRELGAEKRKALNRLWTEIKLK
ncbi:MAG: spermidine/putrescine ABC transporter substrate-binding protein [Deltaproteobacteria bacterium]|nr:spermidine/putrescine ABC transporter substrate-binding protein [Deltaproteobacteria bacterium]